MGAILELVGKLLGVTFGGSGAASSVANGAKVAALVAALPLAWRWYQGHGADVLWTMHVSDAVVVGVVLFVLFVFTHNARGPGQ